MYNSFRMLKCIPFDEEFPWAQGHWEWYYRFWFPSLRWVQGYKNLYDWLKGAHLVSIGYFYPADADDKSHGWDKRIYLRGDNLIKPDHRKVVDSRTRVGLIDAAVLIFHESRHAAVNIGHNCGTKDSNLDYMGAWAVQYYCLKMMGETAGNFFTEYQKSEMLYRAQRVLDTRFCDLN